MKYRSAFDIIGPVMVGPSSSHTAGAVRIGKMARTLFGKKPQKAIISLYGSFAKTFKGHGTDVAVVAGILDFDTFDQRIPYSLTLAKEEGIEIDFIVEEMIPEHPNTVKIQLFDGKREFELVGISIGGGTIEITELNSFKLRLSGEHPAIIVVHQDQFGMISQVTKILAEHRINIGHMEVSRKEKGQMALMVIEVDEPIEDSVIGLLEELPNVKQIVRMVQ